MCFVACLCWVSTHYIKLHYVTSHHFTLDQITLHYITLHYSIIYWLYIRSDYVTLRYVTLQHNLLGVCGVPVNIVPQEEEIAVWRIADLVKVSQKVFILSVYVTTYHNRCTELQHHRLREEELTGLGTQLPDLILRNVNLQKQTKNVTKSTSSL